MKKTIATALAMLATAAMATLERDVAFLTKHAPEEDLPLPGEYVTNNCVLAAMARETAPEQYPDEIYLEYVLPYSVIREGRDDWREEFRERFKPLVADCTNAYDAAVTLDRKIWDMIGVHYNVKRDKARQSPRHSMRIGMASCTGISIILIDACRSLGIPARLVGCNWTTIPGNHSWVEVWSRGGWHVVASGEKEREDNIWFLDYAGLADSSRADRRIYASRWSPSSAGTRFWQTWEHPQKLSDVPADDVTASYRDRPVFAVVISPETAADKDWLKAAELLKEKHRDESRAYIAEVAPTNATETLRSTKPDYVAFVMKPRELLDNALIALKTMMRTLDDDPYDDALWGIVTGPDARTACRIASSSEPSQLRRMLATTGVPPDIVPGRVCVFSDAYPKGEWWEKSEDGAIVRNCMTGDLSGVFADAWERLDPEMLLTSSHASERNMEMPFSQGTILADKGIFLAGPSIVQAVEFRPLSRPRREKIWLAAGNCLIANHLDEQDMVMTALSFGKVNQFAGYFKTTWFGYIGWNTWRYFREDKLSLVESYYAANRDLQRKLETGDWKDKREKAGLEWDRDATIFYGDPMLKIGL